jgi:hypothetical protein
MATEAISESETDRYLWDILIFRKDFLEKRESGFNDQVQKVKRDDA